MSAILKFAFASAALFLMATSASADCYADYKAKQGNPLRLQYGVIQLNDEYCNDPEKMRAEIARRIRVDNWVLLNVLGVFGADGLENRRKSAGEFFLRY